MAKVSVIPKMTSNTTPDPYIVTASSEYTDMPAWKAFNKDNTEIDSCWASLSQKTGWVCIDCNVQVRTSSISITSRNTTAQPTVVLSSLILQGSDDNVNWFNIAERTNVVSEPNKNVVINYEPVSYRYYKTIVTNDVGTVVAIGELDFLYDDSIEALTFKKTLSANVPDTINAGMQEVHFTEKGEIFTYASDGSKLQLGCSREEFESLKQASTDNKTNLSAIISSKGVVLTGAETMAELIDKVKLLNSATKEISFPSTNMFSYKTGSRITHVSMAYGIASVDMVSANGGFIAAAYDNINSPFYAYKNTWSVQDGICCDNSATSVENTHTGELKSANSATTQSGKSTWHTIIIDPFLFDAHFSGYIGKNIYIDDLIFACPKSDGNVTSMEIYITTEEDEAKRTRMAKGDPVGVWEKIETLGALPIAPIFNKTPVAKWASLVKLRVLSSNMNYTEISAIKAMCSKIRYTGIM